MEIGARETMNGFVWVPQREPPPPPLYDAEVEYLESTTAGASGGQGITLDCPAFRKIEIKFQFISIPTVQARVAQSSPNAGAWNLYINGNSILSVSIQQDWKASGFSSAQNRDLYVATTDLPSKTSTVVDVTASTTKTVTHTVNPLYRRGLDLFYRSDATDASKFAHVRIYFVKAWDASGDLIIDLIPVRIGREGMMFDRVTQSFFRNQFSGAFLVGHDVVSYRNFDNIYDAEVEYIAPATAASYVETGIWAGSSLRIEAGFWPTTWSSYAVFYGCGTAETENSHRLLYTNTNNQYVYTTLGNRQGNSPSSSSRTLPVGRLTDFVADDPGKYVELGGFRVTSSSLTYGTTPGSDKTLKLFSTTVAGNATINNIRCSYFRVYVSRELKLDLIPVRVGTQGYMFDRVSERLMPNSANADIWCGPDSKTIRQHTSKSYYQTGLIAQWDGVENVGPGMRDLSSPVWKDLVGNGTYDFELEDGRFDLNGMVMPDPIARAAVTPNMIPWTDIKTAEVYADVTKKPPEVKARYIFATFSSKVASGGYDHDARMLAWNNSASNLIGWMPKASSANRDGNPTSTTPPLGWRVFQTVYPASGETATTNPTKFRINNVQQASSWAGTGAANGLNMHLSQAVGTVCGFLGKIHTIRLYNRQLSDAEMNRHYGIDLSRFGPKPPYTARSYVQAGLLAHWDGIENAGYGIHDPEATTWVDLTGNGYDAEQRVSSGWHWGTDCYVGTARNGHGFVLPAEFTTLIKSIYNCHHIEFVFKPADASRCTIFGQWVSTPGMNIEYSPYSPRNFRTYYSGSPDFASPVWTIRGLVRAAPIAGCNGSNAYHYINGGSCWYNGAAQPAADKFGDTAFVLGGEPGRTNMSMCGELCSIRVYGRAGLTAPERLYNYTLDKIRFNIPQ